MFSSRNRVLCLGLLGSIGLAGCGGAEGDNLPRQAVSGTVTFDNVPVSHGTIQFRGIGSGADKPGTIAGGEIKTGQYSIPRADGPVPGGYRVIISSTEESAAPATPDNMPGQVTQGAKELIPTKYNVNSTLDREIKEGDNKLDFELKK